MGEHDGVKVIPILEHQSRCIIDVFCRDCAYEGKEMIAVTMLDHPERIRCRGCGKAGFLTENFANK